MIAFGALALLPLFPPPFLKTSGISFGGTMAQFAMLAIIAIGLNVVVGQAGLLDLGYVGFYAVGAYTVALADQPGQPVEQNRCGVVHREMGLAGVCADRDGRHGDGRADPGHPHVAVVGRLPSRSSPSDSARSSACWPTTWLISPTGPAD